MSGLTEAYKGLITSEHRGRPKFMSTIDALLQFGEAIYSVGVYLDEDFDLDEAVGAQEDVLGEIVGASRELGFQPHTQNTAILNDEDYRVLLKAKIAKNLWKGGIGDLQTIWQNLFGEDIIIIDNQDMTIEVQIRNVPSSVVQEMILQGYIVPKPQSVGMNYHMIRSNDGLFYLGGCGSQHKRYVVGPAKPDNGTDYSNLYFGGAHSQYKRYTVGPKTPTGGTANATSYYRGIHAIYRRNIVTETAEEE